VVNDLPRQASNVLQNGVTYVDLVDSQLQYFITQFNVFAGLMRAEVSGNSCLFTKLSIMV